MFDRAPDGTATLGGVPIPRILLEARSGTPAYLYDLDAIRKAARSLEQSFEGTPHLIAYAVKANAAGPILRTLFREGCGADVVSGGELALVLEAGLSPDKIVFSGVAKRDDEIDLAISAGGQGILAIQAESVEEIVRVSARARALGVRARLSLRVNPSIAIDTHAHVATGHDSAKFGIARGELGEAYEVIRAAQKGLELVGLSSHIGSTQTTTAPYLAAARVLFDIVKAREASEGRLAFADTGGGFGIDYGAGCPVTPADFARELVAEQRAANLAHLTLVVEPGRSMVGSFGVLASSVIQTKESRSTGRRWIMIDAGMNDLLRPALYQARHRIESVAREGGATASFRVVGPICESTDDFGAYDFESMPPPSLVIIRDAGAYGFTMSSQYNARSLPAEVFVSDGHVVGVHQALPLSGWIKARLQGL